MTIRRLALRDQLQDKRRLYGLTVIVLALVVLDVLFQDRTIAHCVLIGGVSGLVVHWWKTCSSVVLVPSRHLSRSEIMRWLQGLGYVDVAGTNTLKPDLPDWQCFDSQTITMEMANDGTRITGPHYILKKLVSHADGLNAHM